ncbi:peptidylprolyl isomerase [Thiohalobacter thiocyanaticus]|uniref:Chaperone SurA n=1 Tax=Thiohalobacter thiocyanaticus TaxID=585455 RepID=A0A426QMY1_9GAMM|nr:peptidylprolyl isomerase [Thiohalobacter thiocyanaticus]RRQ23109.1 molecular chaperone SurA [Thiohalobacter thiocyanaticus]
MHTRFLPIFLFLGLLLGLPVQAAAQALNRIVAVVNDDVILASELEDKVRLVRSQLAQQDTQAPDPAQLERQVLERLIMERLQLQVAERNNIEVDDETLNANLRNIAAQNGVSLTEFRQTLESEGMDYAAFREELRNQIMINRLRQQTVINRIDISDQEVDNLLASQTAWSDQTRDYHLGHILIATPEAAAPEQIQAAEREAGEVLERLRGGADFSETAVAVSESETALEGGDLGWRKAAQLPSLFADVVRDMQPGEISDLIRSPSGFHIIKLIEVRGDERHVITQSRVRHILLQPDEMLSESGVRLRIEQLRDRLETGADFADLARSHSTDKVSASNGGDLGWVNPGDMVPEFEEAMNRLEPGEISEPVQTRFGWHLIQVLERRERDSTDDYQRSRAREMIRQRKTDEEMELWLRRLRDESYIEYRLEPSAG